MEKRCFKCGVVKTLDAFYVHSQMSDGHLGKCKECAKKDARERYGSPAGRLKVAEYERSRFQSDARKQKLVEYQRTRRSSHPEKYRARTAVEIAIRSGELRPLQCEVCEDPKTQAHHPNYDEPLNVKWLCFRHHREEHGQVVLAENHWQKRVAA